MDRYKRMLELDKFTLEDIEKLKTKKVLIIGVGGVGQHVSTYLVTNGVTNLAIIDFDVVEISNLNRQILLKESDIGKRKVDVVKEALLVRNSEIPICAYNLFVDESNVSKVVLGYDLVIDATDNWKSKLLISKATYEQRIPLLHIGVDGSRGQVCLFVKKSLSSLVNDDVLSAPKDGVIGPMVGLISSLASSIAIDYLTGKNDKTDILFYYDDERNILGKTKL